MIWDVRISNLPLKFQRMHQIKPPIQSQWSLKRIISCAIKQLHLANGLTWCFFIVSELKETAKEVERDEKTGKASQVSQDDNLCEFIFFYCAWLLLLKWMVRTSQHCTQSIALACNKNQHIISYVFIVFFPLFFYIFHSNGGQHCNGAAHVVRKC